MILNESPHSSSTFKTKAFFNPASLPPSNITQDSRKAENATGVCDWFR